MQAWISLIAIAFGLAMDAFATSIVDGLRYCNSSKRHGVIVALTFGVFQGVMPLIGYYLNRGPIRAKFNGRKLYKDGAWNTLCLPFNMTVEQLAAAKTTEGHPLYGATIWEMDVTGWYNTSNQRSDTKNATFCY